ncbi:MAG: biotin--[acetyl-CoA-carboxylase] ligase [Bacteroidales bacterium]|jgi:BirA family biotin operon repressor/biotin-[acetyl-CoA-carboxylase] ligase|nr:biotin--[acetyl-CoA-carboxylase] ligase [Bacteroidales bacterium]NLK80420.1 biotin--[acetyl-CoA-carboxylase] ligase [Bacteroidales bacterium]HKM30964.1 biotin--[acetyl-CoA-carboxylase] ligase [Bacteroidales bacterium]
MFEPRIIRLEEIDSTNSEARRNLEHAPEGTVWTALYQTSGRGQYNRHWESSKGMNLLATLLLRPVFLPTNKQFLISKCTALAICDFLQALGPDAVIKWPNDIYINSKKICGILIEHQVSGNKLLSSIIGFGINVNQCHFPGAPNPTSILLETNTHYPVDMLLPQVLQQIQKWYQRLKDGNIGLIDSSYENLLTNKSDYEKNRTIDSANNLAASAGPCSD